jgi:hypothetical protein
MPFPQTTVVGWLIFVAGASTAVRAEGQGVPVSPPRCDTPEYRQLDFWVGDWDVTEGGKPAGVNRITNEEDGCLIHEHWTGKGEGNVTGQSFNFYDRQDRKWHQVWVSNSGYVLDLAGSYAQGTLTYEGETRKSDGKTVRHRLSFHANADGTVRQFWETSSGGGATWETAFDGLYRKQMAAQ